MFQSIQKCIGIWGIVFGLMSVVTAQETEWYFVDYIDLHDRIGSSYNFDKATLSPGGTQLAWIEQEGLCLHHLLRTVTTCHEWDWSTLMMQRVLRYNTFYLSWSPDGRYLAIAKTPFVLSYDTDIWLFDTADAKFRHVTDDGFIGSPRLSSETRHPPLDYLPVWVSSDKLLFLRTYIKNNPETTTEPSSPYDGLWLYSVALDNGEIVEEMELSDYMFPVQPSMALSSDGRQLALIAPDLTENPLVERRLSLWLIDLQTYEIERVSGQDEWALLLPEAVRPLQLDTLTESLHWLPDSQKLFVASKWSTESEGQIPIHFILDTRDKMITPVSDSLENVNEMIFSPLVTIIPYDEPSLKLLAFYKHNNAISLYQLNLYTMQSELLQVIDYSFSSVGHVAVMSRNGYVLANNTTLLRFTR